MLVVAIVLGCPSSSLVCTHGNLGTDQAVDLLVLVVLVIPAETFFLLVIGVSRSGPSSWSWWYRPGSSLCLWWSMP